MTSLRRRLFAVLVAATGVIWLCAVVWIQYSTRAEISHVLDRRLEESAHMVASLIARQGVPQTPIDPQALGLTPRGPALSHQLICQVWSLDGSFHSASETAPDAPMGGEVTGFKDSVIDTGEGPQTWRVYTYVDAGQGIRVMVGDAVAMRQGLVSRVVWGLLGPALIILPLLAVVIWWAIGQGLQPLAAIARQLDTRPATDLDPIGATGAPVEVQPMIAALDGLFARVAQQRDREQRFTAFAAHELKTPLAGLRMQADVALIAGDEATRLRALQQIRSGVDRTDRLVRQLLDLTAAEYAPDTPPRPAPVAEVIAHVALDLAPLAAQRAVTLHRAGPTGLALTTGRPTLLTLALRNILENAILFSPVGGRVDIGLSPAGGPWRITISDAGAGLSPADLALATEPFFRGPNAGQGSGSGLGLAIVQAACARLGADFRLSVRDHGGMTAEITLLD